jgi:hypothetical protein
LHHGVGVLLEWPIPDTTWSVSKPIRKYRQYQGAMDLRRLLADLCRRQREERQLAILFGPLDYGWATPLPLGSVAICPPKSDR